MPSGVNDTNYDKDIIKEADQILSTFKFIKSTTEAGISNWKTYQNKKYGFEIKLPNDWQVVTEAEDIFFNSQENLKKNLEISNKAIEENWYEDEDFILPSNPNILFQDSGDMASVAYWERIELNSNTLEEYVKKQNSQNYSKMNFAGQTAILGKQFEMYATTATLNVIYMEKNNHLYKIWLESEVGMDSQLRDQILSTFKFTK